MKPSAHELSERGRKLAASAALAYVQRWAAHPTADPVELGHLAENVRLVLKEMSRLADLVPEVERLRLDLRLARSAANKVV